MSCYTQVVTLTLTLQLSTLLNGFFVATCSVSSLSFCFSNQSHFFLPIYVIFSMTERPFPKHCPHHYINYCEDALKMADRLKRRAMEEQQTQRRASFGDDEGKGNSPARRESLNSSPASSINSRRDSINYSGCYSTGVMTTASTLNATPLHTVEASGDRYSIASNEYPQTHSLTSFYFLSHDRYTS